MPRVPHHALTWSQDDGHYALYAHGQAELCFRPGEEEAWQAWLGAVTSFAFQGASGSLNVYQEARSRGGRYWYAYHTIQGRTRKQYLGRTPNVSFARLEQVAAALSSGVGAAPPATVHTGRGAERGSREALSAASDTAGTESTLPSTKLAPPRLPVALVGREGLLAELDTAFSTPLTLVSASAGWGKTTLLSAWVRRHPHRVAWLSLDALDNELTRFWSGVIAALRTREPRVGAVALSMLRSPQRPPVTAIVTALLDELAGAGEDAAPILLLLDDYQVIQEPAIHESLLFFLEHLPVRLHLLLSSRVDPGLPLARLRVRGQLAELRAADLRFTRDEAAGFLQQALGFPLADEEVLALERRTEGWVAGLQLAALSLRKQEDRAAWIASFTGSHRYLLDYVQDEILGLQPLPIQRFLLRVAVLTRINAALCQAVSGEPASQEVLEILERSNLFVVPLDEGRRWYRLHDLFREALLAQAEASEPELLPSAHRRAAEWYEAHGEVREAIAHALAAEDFPFAAAMVEREAPTMWLAGEAQTVHAWLQALPDEVLWRHACLALDAALRFLESLHATARASYTVELKKVEQTLARVEEGLRTQGIPAHPEAEVAVIRRRLRLLRALIESREILNRDDAESMRRLAQETEELSMRDEVRWRMVAHSLTYWLTESIEREGGLLIPRLLEAKRQAIDGGDHLATSRVMRWLAFAYGRAGQLRAAHSEALEALALMERMAEHSAQVGYVHLGMAGHYYAWNRLEEASDSTHQVLRIARTWQQADLLIVGHSGLVALALARGDLADAREALEQEEALVRQERFEMHPHWAVADRVRYWLAASDLPSARTWAEHVEFTSDTLDPNRRGEYLMLVRVYLAQHQYSQALEALERFREYLDRPGDVLTGVEFLALRVVALHHARRSAQAREVAARLFSLTEPEGWLRVYLDEGEPMKRALEALLAAPQEDSPNAPTLSRSYISLLLAAFEQERHNARPPSPRATTSSQTSSSPHVVPPASTTLIEPLTRREQEVLQHLATGASNQEIAAALVVSLATVKKHVSNLLDKLGVESRTQAVARAREASLL